MSTKIWVAWRVPISRFGEATDIIHQEMSESFYQKYKQLVDNYWQKNPELLVGDAAMNFEKETHEQYKMNTLDFTTYHSRGFQFLLDKQFACILPYGDWNIKIPDWFKDFHYQNQTDRPDGISAREWRYRKKVWDRIWIQAPTVRIYTYKVIDPHEGFLVTFMPFLRRWMEENSVSQLE